MKKTNTYGDCTICGGRVTSKLVEKICTRGGHLIGVVKDVPAGVCDQCGERYYKAPVLKKIERQLSRSQQKAKLISVPVARFAA